MRNVRCSRYTLPNYIGMGRWRCGLILLMTGDDPGTMGRTRSRTHVPKVSASAALLSAAAHSQWRPRSIFTADQARLLRCSAPGWPFGTMRQGNSHPAGRGPSISCPARGSSRSAFRCSLTVATEIDFHRRSSSHPALFGTGSALSYHEAGGQPSRRLRAFNFVSRSR